MYHEPVQGFLAFEFLSQLERHLLVRLEDLIGQSGVAALGLIKHQNVRIIESVISNLITVQTHTGKA